VGRRKNSDFLSLEEVGRLAGAVTRSGSISRLSIYSAWSRAVGPTLRAVTRPVRFQQGRLVVDVGSAVWIREMVRLKGEIIDRLSRLLPEGSVTALSFRLNLSLPPASERKAGARIVSIAVGPPNEASGAAADSHSLPVPGLSDDDLRRRLSDVARRYLRARA